MSGALLWVIIWKSLNKLLLFNTKLRHSVCSIKDTSTRCAHLCIRIMNYCNQIQKIGRNSRLKADSLLRVYSVWYNPVAQPFNTCNNKHITYLSVFTFLKIVMTTEEYFQWKIKSCTIIKGTGKHITYMYLFNQNAMKERNL